MNGLVKKIILTVDDTAVNLAIIRSILRNNYDVRVCKDGTMAKYMVDHIQVDLALLDINMPIVSGFDLLEYIRTKESRKDLPVIFVTAFANKEFISKAVTAGALDYIIKPIKPDVLNSKIASIFRAQKAAAVENIEPPKNPLPVVKTEEKPIPRRNAPLVDIVDYLSYMFTSLNEACLSGNCDQVEKMVKELDGGNYGGIINRKIDELASLMISFEYQAMIKNISSIFIALGSFDLYNS